MCLQGFTQWNLNSLFSLSYADFIPKKIKKFILDFDVVNDHGLSNWNFLQNSPSFANFRSTTYDAYSFQKNLVCSLYFSKILLARLFLFLSASTAKWSFRSGLALIWFSENPLTSAMKIRRLGLRFLHLFLDVCTYYICSSHEVKTIKFVSFDVIIQMLRYLLSF